MIRYTAVQVKTGWIVYDTKLMRPLSVNTYSTQAQALAKAAAFN